ncbi:MAG: cell invasion protein SipD [Herbaspirillum sp.]|nr:cell invasion protein SipD [Herbaspirillum sp.]
MTFYDNTAHARTSSGRMACLDMVDLGPIDKMIADIEALSGTGPNRQSVLSLSTPAFQAWKTGFDAQADLLKNTASAMAQKLTNAQSIYENLVKVLSGMIASMLETDKAFLQP